MNAKPSQESKQSASQPERLIKKVARRVVKTCAVIIASITGIVLLGLLPANSGFSETSQGIEIGFRSSSIHTDIIIPIRNEIMDWSHVFRPEDFIADMSEYSHMAIGWGDKRFFIETQDFDQLNPLTAIRAVALPTEACFHVYLEKPNLNYDFSLRISENQYREMVKHIHTTLGISNGSPARTIKHSSYGNDDAFYSATGKYHLFNTCNSWTAQCLRKAGIKAPHYALLPGTPTIYIK